MQNGKTLDCLLAPKGMVIEDMNNKSACLAIEYMKKREGANGC